MSEVKKDQKKDQETGQEMNFSYKEVESFKTSINLEKPQLISDKDIQKLEDEIKVDFTKEEKEKLKIGEPVQKENMEFIPRDPKTNEKVEGVEGKVANGEIQLKMVNGVLKTNIDVASDKLVIPDKVLGQTLSKKQKQDLTNGEFVAIEPKKGSNVLLKVNEDLKKVTIKTPKDLGIPKKVGEYELNKGDLEKLANGKEMSPKVFEDKKTGKFILANLSFDKEKSEMSFSNVKEVTPLQAAELKEKYNTQETVVSAVANMGMEFEKEAKQENKTENNQKEGIVADKPEEKKEASKEVETKETSVQAKDVQVDTQLPKEIQEAIDKGDINKLKDLENKKPLTDKQADIIKEHPKLDSDDKTIILAQFGHEKEAEKNFSKGKPQEKDVKVNEKGNSTSKTKTQDVGKAVKTEKSKSFKI